MAQYHKECQYQGSYGIWQYTDALEIGGQTFDGNWAYKDYPAITGGSMAKSRVLQTQENRMTRGFGNGHSGVDFGRYHARRGLDPRAVRCDLGQAGIDPFGNGGERTRGG